MNESDSPQTIETPQPVAWRAYDTDGSEAVYSLYEQARAAADEMNWSVEPLYRSPTLTDAERQAVEAAVRIIIDYEDEMDGYPSGAAATLRGLLERTRATGSVKGLAAIRAAEQDAEITPEIAAALEGERNRATVKPKALPPRAS